MKLFTYTKTHKAKYTLNKLRTAYPKWRFELVNNPVWGYFNLVIQATNPEGKKSYVQKSRF